MDSSERDLGALTGALFVVLVLVAFFALGGDTPDGDAKAAKVVSFYTDHDTKEIAAAVVLALASVPLIFFGATLRERYTAALGSQSSRLPAFTLGAAVAGGAGFLMAAGIHFTLADYANNISPVALQAINALDGDMFLPFTSGLAAMILGASLLTLRVGLLPKWMAYLGIVMFVAFFTPVGFAAFGLSGIWIIIASVILCRAGEPAAEVS